ncbi:hypothetical protein [Nocardia amamiensis]|uniref:hypothetical protein n=1 Tax=Nocardia amamiensis TaxID=404578 RepID=UPI0012F48B5F|nr:hypothetical protein [Nocardia amamiensis]
MPTEPLIVGYIHGYTPFITDPLDHGMVPFPPQVDIDRAGLKVSDLDRYRVVYGRSDH